MKKKILIWIIMIVGILILLPSCESDENEGNEEKVSSYNETESHKMGQNCMSCHKSGGKGEGWFNLAGTVYEDDKSTTYPNTTVKIYDEPNGAGSLISTIEVDGLGNFYTTNNIDFGNGLYASVSGDTETIYMIDPVTSGQCNSCHGTNTDRIWTR
jgi:hypothetical protein